MILTFIYEPFEVIIAVMVRTRELIIFVEKECSAW